MGFLAADVRGQRGASSAQALLRRVAILAGALAVLALPALADTPARVMSLNVCTDQLAMLLAAPGQLVSVSELASDPGLSFHHAMAAGYKKNHGLAEEVFLARPDVVVTGTFSLHNTTALLRHLGFKVEEFDFTQTLNTLPAEIRRMGDVLGQRQKADAMAAAFETELAAETPACEPAPTIIAYGQNGVALGSGTLADSVVKAAGFRNLAAELGYVGMTPFQLELLVNNRPDAIVLSRPLAGAPALADQAGQHPAIRAAGGRRVFVPDAAWSCGGPFTLEAVKALRVLREEIAPCDGKPAGDPGS
jgi:iron complex transport system substrate-binding protein